MGEQKHFLETWIRLYGSVFVNNTCLISKNVVTKRIAARLGLYALFISIGSQVQNFTKEKPDATLVQRPVFSFDREMERWSGRSRRPNHLYGAANRQLFYRNGNRSFLYLE
jgi:hypothetical protein